jgi:hypothetical protein
MHHIVHDVALFILFYKVKFSAAILNGKDPFSSGTVDKSQLIRVVLPEPVLPVTHIDSPYLKQALKKSNILAVAVLFFIKSFLVSF